MLADLDVLFYFAWKAQKRLFRQLPRYLLNGGLTKKNMAEHLALFLEDLGPTFVKMGQILSSRPDLVPEPYFSSLERLQDAVLPFSSHEAEEVIFRELPKKRARELIRHFDPMPVASGAFAQVHKSVLPNGTAVAIKVQRPELEQRVQRELKLLQQLARVADAYLTRQEMVRFTSVLENLERGIRLHLDFSIEARNARRFARLFFSIPHIHFPEIFTQYSTKKLLTMSFFDGVKLSRYFELGADPLQIMERGFFSLLKMLLLDGFVHADMHPANILVLPNSELAYIDLGLTAKLTAKMRKTLVKLIFAIAMKDVENTLRLLFTMLHKRKHLTFPSFAKAMRPLIEQYLDISLEQLKLSELLTNFFRNLYRLGLSFPADYTLAFISLVTVEGTARRIAPQFRPFDYARQFFLSHPELPTV